MTRSIRAPLLAFTLASCAHAAAPAAPPAWDGVSQPDQDGDGISDADDACPAVAGDVGGGPSVAAAPAAPSGSVDELALDFSNFNWGDPSNSSKPAPPPPAPAPAAPPQSSGASAFSALRSSPSTSSSSSGVTDADVQAEIARIQAELGTVEAAAPPPLAADQCSGLKVYVAAAPDNFKAVQVLRPSDSEYTHEWRASPALPRWDRCTISNAAARPYLSCDYFSLAVVDYASEYASLAQQVESCFPGWEKEVDVANKADKHWKTLYGPTNGTQIILTQYLDKGGYKQFLVVHQD